MGVDVAAAFASVVVKVVEECGDVFMGYCG